ncbi:MAG TPA: hypothetical protein VGJ20_20515 [Xanthobacteraceae bacterium]
MPSLDPLNVNQRLYRQVAKLLDQLENLDKSGEVRITLKERIAALVAIGRIQTIFMGLRKENADEPTAGSSVRKYAGNFKGTGDTRRRTKGSRPAFRPTDDPVPDDWFEPGNGDDSDAA